MASALATVELDAGSDRRARRLFAASLQAPNDNALAQAESVADRLTLPGLQDQLADSPRAHEALALAADQADDLDAALDQTWLWLLDQPFSVKPAVVGSHIAARARRFEEGARFAERGLLANRGSPLLTNNLAFCLAKLDRADEARQRLDAVDPHRRTPKDWAYHWATQGLVEFRDGNPQLGRELYLRSIRSVAAPEDQALAFLMLVTEEIRIGNAAELGREIEEARRRASQHLTGPGRHWLDYLSSDDALQLKPGSEPGPAWTIRPRRRLRLPR